MFQVKVLINFEPWNADALSMLPLSFACLVFQVKVLTNFEHWNADALSMLPLSEANSSINCINKEGHIKTSMCGK